MARRKYKMTGCARFFLVIIILAPLAYLGAAYYNGEDGIANIKNFLGISESSSDETSGDDIYKETGSDLRKEIDKLKEQVEDLEEENESLKEEIKKLQQETSGNDQN